MSLPGGMEWIIIGLVIVLLFGARKIPELAKGLGQGLREFKKAQKDDKDKITDETSAVKDKEDKTKA